jgi:hypothetical protein
LAVEHVKEVENQPCGRTGRQLVASKLVLGGWASEEARKRVCSRHDGWHHTEISLLTPIALCSPSSLYTAKATSSPSKSRACWGRRAKKKDWNAIALLVDWILTYLVASLFPPRAVHFLELGFLDKIIILISDHQS